MGAFLGKSVTLVKIYWSGIWPLGVWQSLAAVVLVAAVD